MDRQLFDDAIGSPPPSTVDVEAVIARQRRAALVRRVGGPALVAAAAVAAVTFGVALAVPGGLTGNPGGGGITPGGGSGTGSSANPMGTSQPVRPGWPPGMTDPCALPTDLPAIPGEPADIAARLHAALDAAVRAQLPDAQLTANPYARYENDRQYGPLEFFHVRQDGEALGGGACRQPQDYYLAKATITDAAGAGNILAYVGRGTATPAMLCSTGSRTPPGETSCEQRTGPAGEQITLKTLRAEEGSTQNRVDVIKPDSTIVTLYTENVAVDGKEGTGPQRPTPPLTPDQLLAIALLPTLTLFP